MNYPKFEITCKKSGSNWLLSITNVSSVIVSNICNESFEVVSIDNDNLCISISMPSHLIPNNTQEIILSNGSIAQRRVGSKEIVLNFRMEDEYSNVFCCRAKKNVEMGNSYMEGKWNSDVELLSKKE